MVLLTFNYLTLILIIYDYILLLTIDPVDPRLI